MTHEAFLGVPCTVNTGMGTKGLVTRVSGPSATRVRSTDQAVRLCTPRLRFTGRRGQLAEEEDTLSVTASGPPVTVAGAISPPTLFCKFPQTCEHRITNE